MALLRGLFVAGSAAVALSGLVAQEVSADGELREFSVGADGDIASFMQMDSEVKPRRTRGLRAGSGVQARGASASMAVGASGNVEEMMMMMMEVVPDVMLLQTAFQHSYRFEDAERPADAATASQEVDAEEVAEASPHADHVDQRELVQTEEATIGAQNQTIAVEPAEQLTEQVSFMQTSMDNATEAVQAAVVPLTVANTADAPAVLTDSPKPVTAQLSSNSWTAKTSETVRGVLLQSPGSLMVSAAKALAARSPWTLRPADGSSVLDRLTVEPWKQPELLVFLVCALLMQLLLFRWLTPPMVFEKDEKVAAAAKQTPSK